MSEPASSREPDNHEGKAPSLPWWPLPPWHDAMLADVLSHRAEMPHALLLHGLGGIGKHALALHIAQGLLCETPAAGVLACGACAGCRYVLAGQHPDLMRLELLCLDAETGEPGTVDSISIDRVRALIDFVQLTSHRQRGKVAVIAPAERMTLPAANALLKTLEEPPPGTYLLLVADQPGRLPPTITSRCRKLPIATPQAPDAQAWLAHNGVPNPEVVLAQAGGAALAALAIADAHTQQERHAWLSALARPEALAVVQIASRVEQGAREQRKARLAHAVDWILGWTGDLARVAAGQPAQRNPDFGMALSALAPRVARLRLFRYHRAVLEQRALLAHPLQPRLVAESLLLEYRALFDRTS
jgi:DNA polymerase-3 subunit delta'